MPDGGRTAVTVRCGTTHTAAPSVGVPPSTNLVYVCERWREKVKTLAQSVEITFSQNLAHSLSFLSHF